MNIENGRRRALCTVAAACAAPLLLSGHSPYRQWVVYRQTHLVILTSRDDPAADELGERMAAVMLAALPDSKAAVGRGPHVQRIGSLLATRQSEVGVLSHRYAAAMLQGQAPFDTIGPVPLRALVANADHVLVCRDDFSRAHAYLLAEALTDKQASLAVAVPRAGATALAAHAGALAFADGRPFVADRAP